MLIRIIILAMILPFCACSTGRRALPPVAAIATPTGASLTQSGDAAVPASVSTKTATQTMTLPAQSAVWIDAKTGAVEYRLAKDTPLTTTTTTEEAKAPQAFTPPAPPTPTEEKDAQVQVWYRIGVAIGMAAAIFGLVRGWDMVMWGGASVAGACLFGLFVKSHPLLLVFIGAGIALKFAGPYIWHTQLKNQTVKTS